MVAACDASPAMIAQAESHGGVMNGSPIAYTVAPAAPLPYPDQTFDLVTCQQGLQFFGDAGAALGEMARVLVPGGRLVASVWCPPEDCSVFHAFMLALRNAGLPELADLMTTPFPRWTADELVARTRQRGFREAAVTAVTRDLVFPGGLAETMAAFGGTPLGPRLGQLDAEASRALVAAAERTFAPLRAGSSIQGPMRSWILLATV